MKLLVTGSNGFVGKALTGFLETRGHSVVRAVRKSADSAEIAVGDLDKDTDWRAALSGAEAVVHLAARVHDLKDTGDQLAAYRKTNTEGTLALARAAGRAGVKRFIFISSVKALGEGNVAPYSESDIPAPKDAYGISKWEAEQGLHAMAKSGMEIVILRPPLVYGPGVGANFLRLLKLAASGLPLPLGAIHNRRSMIYVGNLVDAITLCLEHPLAAGKTFVVADGKPVSVSELLRMLAKAMQRPARLWPAPLWVFHCLGKLTGRRQDIARLIGSLAVDDTNIRKQLGWQPPFSLEEGLAITAAWYRGQRSQDLRHTVRLT